MKRFVQIIMMLFPLVLGFSSCDKAKELEPNPLAKQLSGLWWSLTDISGTLPQNFSGQDYTRMGQAFQLNEDGTGYSVTFFFNDENGNPVFTWTSAKPIMNMPTIMTLSLLSIQTG